MLFFSRGSVDVRVSQATLVQTEICQQPLDILPCNLVQTLMFQTWMNSNNWLLCSKRVFELFKTAATHLQTNNHSYVFAFLLAPSSG